MRTSMKQWLAWHGQSIHYINEKIGLVILSYAILWILISHQFLRTIIQKPKIVKSNLKTSKNHSCVFSSFTPGVDFSYAIFALSPCRQTFSLQSRVKKLGMGKWKKGIELSQWSLLSEKRSRNLPLAGKPLVKCTKLRRLR